MIPYIIAAISVFSLSMIFLFLIRSNKNKLKRKIEYGKAIPAKVISWNDVPGRPTSYVIKVEYEIDKEKKNKRLKTIGNFAKKYKYEKIYKLLYYLIPRKPFLKKRIGNCTMQYYFFSCFLLVLFLLNCYSQVL